MHQIPMVLVSLILFALTISSIASRSLYYGKTVHVYIVNDIRAGNTVTFHCKSEEDDLGEHSLDYKKVYMWSFHEAVIGKTLFYCNFEWQKSPGQKVTVHANVYDADHDIKLCGADCWRLVKEDGVIALDPDTASLRNMGSWGN